MNKRLEHYKELLQILPRNNIKNSKSYKEKATIMQEIAEEYKTVILKEIKKRYKDLVVTKENEQIKIIEKHLEDIRSKLYLLDDNDSYEKSGLDVSLYDLRKFYENDLVEVNEDIEIVLKQFNLVGIAPTKEDFNYGSEVQEYMTLFLKENDPNSSKLKEEFDKLYWKCPNLIENIYLNFRHLYFKNKKLFDKYYEEKRKDFKYDEEKIQKEHQEYIYLLNSDTKILQDKILNGELDVKDYEESKIVKQKDTIFTKHDDENLNNENLLKLYNTLEEYKNYLKFKDLIEEVKKIYADKNNKSLTKSILKNIEKAESKIKKSDRKLFKLKEDKKNDIINKAITELRDLYKEYDTSKFKEKVVNSLNDNSTLLDVLKLLNAYKINFLEIYKQLNEESTYDEFKAMEKTLEEFINNPNNNFIKHVTITDTKDIKTIILDKYNLVNISLTEEQLEDTNIDSYISTINKIITSIYLEKNNLKYEDLNALCEMKEILKNEDYSLDE